MNPNIVPVELNELRKLRDSNAKLSRLIGSQAMMFEADRKRLLSICAGNRKILVKLLQLGLFTREQLDL